MSTQPAAPRDWDAGTYDRVADPQHEWGLEVLGRLRLGGDETVLDAGCGSGRVTAELLERLPRGRVLAVDAAPAMVAAARAALPADRLQLRCVDLLDLELEQPVDAVLSTATFHWISDHERLFARLAAALRAGGRLVAQCGGEGNIAALHSVADSVSAREPFAQYLAGWRGPWTFASPADTTRRLEAAGFDDVRCWLQSRPTLPPDPPAYLRTVCLRAHLDVLPEHLRAPYVDAVLAETAGGASKPRIDYVRLNIDARRSA